MLWIKCIVLAIICILLVTCVSSSYEYYTESSCPPNMYTTLIQPEIANTCLGKSATDCNLKYIVYNDGLSKESNEAIDGANKEADKTLTEMGDQGQQVISQKNELETAAMKQALDD